MPDAKQAGKVLMQRVIALNGDLDSAEKKPKPRADAAAMKSAPPPLYKQQLDLAATSLEWGAAATPPTAPDVRSPKESLDAQWATYSSISMRPCDELLLSQRILSSNIEDAVTRQYNPAPSPQPMAAEPPTVTDLASLDRVLESAGALRRDMGFEFPLPVQPAPAPAPATPRPIKSRVLVVPASLAWTVLGVFAVCALALAYFVAVSFVCRSPAAFDVRSLRCVPQADFASAPLTTNH